MAPVKSDVWKHFKRLDGKDKTAICSVCSQKCATSSNTSNLWTHLKKHKIFKNNSSKSSGTKPSNTDTGEMDVDVDDPSPQEVVQMGTKAAESESTTPKQMSLEGAVNRAKAYQDGGNRAAELNDALLFMICRDNMPLNTPVKEGFRHFAKVAVPLWSPPTRTTLTTSLESKYAAVFDRMKGFLSQLPAICLTADCWTEHHQTSSYLGITGHYCYNDEMESVVLGVELMTESHTAVNLCDSLKKCLEKWSIAIENVSLVVTDNASNIKLAAKYLVGEDKRIGCIDHLVNLIPKAALGHRSLDKKKVSNVEGVPELVSKIKKIVTLSHTNYNFSNELKRLQMERGRTEGTCLRLLQDNVTRWGSTFLMIDRFLQLEEIIMIACLKFTEVNMLTCVELRTVRAIRDTLKPFHNFTAQMSAEKATTASSVIPMIALLKKNLQEIQTIGDTIGEMFRKFLISETKSRFKDIETVPVLAKATLLDPRFMGLYLSDEAVQTAKTQVLAELITEIRCKNEEAAEPVSQDLEGNDHNYADAAPEPGDLWSSHDKEIAARSAPMSTNDIEAKARSELASFLDRGHVKRAENPMKVWRSIKGQYPFLFNVAMRYLPLLATSVPCERVFSLAGFIADERGNRLTSEHLNQRIFMASVSKAVWNFEIPYFDI